MQSAVEDRVLPDRELVARMVVRDGAALDRLWTRRAALLFPIAEGILHNPVLAERAVSEAFLEAFCAADQFIPGEMTVVAWLTGLARRRAQALAAQTH